MEGNGWDVEVLGFTSWAAQDVLDAALNGRMEEVPGDVVLIASRKSPSDEVLIATSVIGSRPYFFALGPGGTFHHGQDVFDIAYRAQQAWRWNPDALAQLALLGHTLGESTLHPSVRRIPPDATIRFDGRLHIDRGSFWSQVGPTPARAKPSDAIDAFQAALDDALGDTPEPVISMSAGFDSRALLAGALAAGRRPRLLTMGHPESTDRIVAEAIARDSQLDLEVEELTPSDYSDNATAIVRATGGTKLFSHWHTFLYSRRTTNHDGPHLVGSNGEYARTFYFDLGLAARIFDIAGSLANRLHWLARFHRWSADASVPLGQRESWDRCEGDVQSVLLNTAKGPGRNLDGLDRIYAQQRVRHFVGNGLALYALNGDPRSPFLDPRWIKAAGGLSRRDKLGSRHHRAIIHRLGPNLAKFPVNGGSLTLAPPLGYWLRRQPFVGYDVSELALLSKPAVERLADTAALDELFPRPERLQAVADRDLSALDLMLTLAYASEQIR